MPQTLVQILEELGNLDRYARLGTDKKEVINREILDTFYKENPLASKVSEGDESYSNLIQPIREKYKSLRKILYPKKDSTFDAKAKEVIDSMNEVGIENIDSDGFTSNFRRGLTYICDFASAAISALVVQYDVSTEYAVSGNMDLSKEIPYLIGAFLIMKGAFSAVEYLGMKQDLKALQKTAQKTDDFLRKHHIQAKDKG